MTSAKFKDFFDPPKLSYPFGLFGFTADETFNDIYFNLFSEFSSSFISYHSCGEVTHKVHVKSLNHSSVFFTSIRQELIVLSPVPGHVASPPFRCSHNQITICCLLCHSRQQVQLVDVSCMVVPSGQLRG